MNAHTLVAHDFVARISRHDVASLMGLMTPDHRLIDPGGAVVSGLERLRTAWQSYFDMIPDYWITVEETLAHDDTVMLVGRAGGTYAPDGRLLPAHRWQVPAAWRAVVRDGRVAEWQVYADNEPLRIIMAGEQRTRPGVKESEMQPMLRDLSRMFYPLTGAERRKWAAIVAQPEREYVSALEREALARGLQQRALDTAVAWVDREGRPLMLLFRIADPGDLAAVRRLYDTIAAHEAPLAYAFVHQRPDGEGTWDIFHMSKLTYLAHCNRVSGPGTGAEQPDDSDG